MNEKDIKDIYELSPMQQGMLFHSLAAPESAVYINRISYILKGDLYIPAFKRAWQKLVDLHPVLRSSFHWKDVEKPLQVVHGEAKLSLEIEEWSGLSPDEQEERLDAYLKEEGRRGFNLTEAPLMRLALFRCADDAYQFVICQHHMLMDGWCRPLILKEAFAYYEAFRRGENVQLELPRPYRDYIIWLQQQNMISAETFWRNELKGFSSPTPLLTDRIAGNLSAKEDDFAKQRIQLSKASTDAIKALARRHSLTLNTMIQGLWALLLSRYSGEEDVVFGATVSGRPPDLTGVESMIGLFINTLPVRVRVRPEAQLLDWLKDMQIHQAQARQYEYSPLVDVKRWSEVPHTLSLFDSILIFENFPDGAADEVFGSLEICMDRFLDWTNYPLTIEVVPGSELLFLILYDCRLFDDITITRMLAHLKRLLEGMVDDHTSRLCDLPILTEEERHQFVAEWNNTNIDYPMDKCLFKLFEAKVERSPEAIAVVFEDEQVSYRELNQRANQLAHHLRTLGVGPEVLVGICAERSLQMVVGLLGILKAGGAYVPLDPDYPKERLAFMMKDAQIFALLTEEKQLKNLPAFDKPVISLDTVWNNTEKKDHKNIDSGTTSDNLAYVIYTSGSTGKPKGVQIKHKSVVNFLYAMIKRPGLSSNDILLAVTTISFDIHVLELFLPLITGAEVIVVSRETAVDGKRLYELMEKNKITVMQATPSTWQLLLDSGCWNDRLSLKVLCGGEALRGELAAKLLPRCSSLWNMYGPTETTVWSSVEQITSADGIITVGHPINNTQFYIVDGYNRPVPIGVSGELLIGGDGLSSGYLNHSDLYTERFIGNPFSKKTDRRLYRTGDRARYLSDGRVIVLNRMDNQVKIRGFRVELGEIEMALVRHETVHRAVVIVREDDPGDHRLTAYLIPDGSQRPDPMTLRMFLQNLLPDYMLPSAYVWLDSYPVTPNKKLDQRALPAPTQARGVSDNDFDEPETEAERIFAGIFQDILQIDRVGRFDNFFDLGGHSLLAMKVVDRFEKAAGIRMEVGEIFQQTVGQIAAWNEKKIEDKRSKQTGSIKGKLNTVLNKFFALSNKSNTRITKQNQ